jgi:hypothetical protein
LNHSEKNIKNRYRSVIVNRGFDIVLKTGNIAACSLKVENVDEIGEGKIKN